MLVFCHACVVTCEENATEHESILIEGTPLRRIRGVFHNFLSGTLTAQDLCKGVEVSAISLLHSIFVQEVHHVGP